MSATDDFNETITPDHLVYFGRIPTQMNRPTKGPSTKAPAIHHPRM